MRWQPRAARTRRGRTRSGGSRGRGQEQEQEQEEAGSRAAVGGGAELQLEGPRGGRSVQQQGAPASRCTWCGAAALQSRGGGPIHAWRHVYRWRRADRCLQLGARGAMGIASSSSSRLLGSLVP